MNLNVLAAVGRFYGVIGWAERPTRAHVRSIGAQISTLAVTLGIALVVAAVTISGVKIPGPLIAVDVVAFAFGVVIYVFSFLKWSRPSRHPTVAPIEIPSKDEGASAADVEQPFPEQIRKALELERFRTTEITLCGDHLVSLGQAHRLSSRDFGCLDKSVHRQTNAGKGVP